MATTSSASVNTPSSAATAAAAAPSAGAFETDPRVYFDQRSGKWSYEDQGTEFEWDVNRAVWVPVLEDALLLAQQAAYSVPGVDESEPVAAVLARTSKKRDASSADASTSNNNNNNNVNKKSKRPRKAPAPNTAVYITHLPPSTTSEQLLEAFSLAGLILEDANGAPRIKLYHDKDTGVFKREALVVYLQPESVGLAERLLDERELVVGSGEGVMRVKAASWEKKDEEAKAAPTDGLAPTEGKEKGNGKGKGKVDLEKQKAGRRAEKLKAKLADWDSDDETPSELAARAKYARVVVLRGMFSLAELDADPTLLLDLKEDVRGECETMGEVTNVTLYDKEEDGIMTIRFKDEVSAQACISKMNNRFFGGRSISAFLFDGTKRYRKSGQGVAATSLAGTGLGGPAGHAEEADEVANEQARLDNYAQWLEEDREEVP